jgi:hypothetical protein
MLAGAGLADATGLAIRRTDAMQAARSSLPASNAGRGVFANRRFNELFSLA